MRIHLLTLTLLVVSASAQTTDCSFGEFRCANNECVDQQHRCDGVADCTDGSDEEPEICSQSLVDRSITTTVYPVLLPNKTTNKRVLPVSRIGCTAGNFACLSGECISQSLVCDRRKDCRDGSDESASICPHQQPTSTEPPVEELGDLKLIKLFPCDLPPQPKHGLWKIHASMCKTNQNCWPPQGLSKLQPGSHLVYSCERGYVLKGQRDVLCGPEGRWVKRPTCEEIMCPGLGTESTEVFCMRNGEVLSCETPAPVNTVARLDCRDGYVEQERFGAGFKNVTCRVDGKWYPEPLRCDPAPKYC